jgi:hypothetical protein
VIVRIFRRRAFRPGYGFYNHVEDGDVSNRGIGKQYVAVQEHDRGRVRLGQNDCLQGKKEITKESSDLS